MKKFDFLDVGLGPEEQLGSLMALNQGVFLALTHLFRHVSGYNSLLEEEVEDNPAALDYLRQSQEVMAAGQGWIDLVRNGLVTEQELEPLDLHLLLSGAVKRVNKVLDAQSAIQLLGESAEVLVNGSLFQLQNTLVKTLAGLPAKGNPVGCWQVHTRRLMLDENFWRLMKGNCPSGEYYLMMLVDVAQAELPLDMLNPFLDVFLEGAKAGKVQKDMELLQLYGVMKLHGGEMLLCPEHNAVRGIALLLPVQAKRKDMQAPHNVEDPSLCGDETILLVDDEDMIWDVIIDMLQELGYTVLLAGNGREAVEIYRENPEMIDLVILDMVMPEMDGHEAFFELKKLDPQVKVLLSSGYVSEEDARDVLEAGAAGFLQKPYRMEALARKIRRICGR
jgi:CheY-like chemotaxis protein